MPIENYLIQTSPLRNLFNVEIVTSVTVRGVRTAAIYVQGETEKNKSTAVVLRRLKPVHPLILIGVGDCAYGGSITTLCLKRSPYTLRHEP